MFNFIKYYNMKKLFITIFVSLLAIAAKSQNVTNGNCWGYDCLGRLCYVTVDLNNDPLIDGMYLKYTIPAPSENIYSIQGPGISLVFNDLGSTVDILVRKTHLELALADSPNREIPCDVLVEKWVDEYGKYEYNQTNANIMCHYHIVLMIM